MNKAVLFSKASDEWSTPQAFWDELDDEFQFTLDAAATQENKKILLYCGPDRTDGLHDALTVDWVCQSEAKYGGTIWCNPPYSRCREFIAKAANEANCGATVVCLVPSRTDTRWWHEYVWDQTKHQPRAGVEVRFLRGRLKFVGATNSAPFPSVVIIFRWPQ